MFNRKFNIFLITLVFMLSISSVVAIDTSTTDDVDSGDAEDEPPSGSINNDVLGKSTGGEDVVSLASNDLSLYYKNGTRYEVTLLQNSQVLSNTSIIISLNDVNYTRITDDDGKASIAINLNPGNYSVCVFYNGFETVNNIEVLSTISSNDLVKIYRNDTQYYAAFLNNAGNPLADCDVTFNINGVFYTRKTNASGIAKLNINLNSGNYILTAIHPSGLLCSNNVTILNSIEGADIIKFYRNSTQYHATFFNSDGSVLANKNVTFNINGVFYTRTTDNDGVASLNINLLPGEYILTAINPVNNEYYSNLISVLSTMMAEDVSIVGSGYFKVTLFKGDGSLAGNSKLNITVNGQTKTVKTNSDGIASIELKLSGGKYQIVTTDLDTGLKIYNTVTVEHETEYYSCYGVSPDGLTIIAIGRASASGELSQYGYTFYKCVLNRTCPYCGSHNLYWSIFWAGDETTNYGIFPVTGNREAGSAEGHIFCADCDADWSIFGNNHGNGKSLTVLSKAVSCAKADAYTLKNGAMIYS